jgi:subfamily B ATP-binding cassette protein MsbA
MRYTSKRVRRLSLSIQDSMGHLTHAAEENIEGYKIVRSFGGEMHEKEKFNHATRVNRQREMKVIAARAWSVSSVQLVAAIALSATLYVATLDIANSILSPGGFVTLIAAMLALLKPMKDLTTMQNKLYRGLAGAQTVFEMLDEKPEEDLGKKALQRARGKLVFQNVHFSYQPEKEVLQDINFIVEPGEIIALVGRSGSAAILHVFYRSYFIG